VIPEVSDNDTVVSDNEHLKEMLEVGEVGKSRGLEVTLQSSVTPMWQ